MLQGDGGWGWGMVCNSRMGTQSVTEERFLEEASF